MRKINYVKLGNVCRVVSGSTPKKSNTEYWGGDIPWITPAEIDNAAHYVWDTERHITELGVEKASLKELPVGTVLLSSRAPIGKVAITKTPMFCNQGFKNLICSDQVLNEYLYRYLRANTARLQSCGRGATFKELSKKDVENIILPLPSISCQKNIVSKLESIDNVILCLNRLLELFNDLVKSRFVEMFGGFEKRTLVGDLCNCIVPGRDKPKSFSGETPWITTDDLIDGGITYFSKSGLGLSDEEIEQVHARIIPKDSVLMTCVGRLGICSIAGCDLVANQQLHSFLCDLDSINNTFLMYQLKTSKKYMLENAKSVTVQYMNKKTCNSIPIACPPLSLQQEFADFVHQVDKLKFETQQSIEKLQMLYDSLAQEYFAPEGD